MMFRCFWLTFPPSLKCKSQLSGHLCCIFKGSTRNQLSSEFKPPIVIILAKRVSSFFWMNEWPLCSLHFCFSKIMSVLNNSKFLSRVQTLLDKAEGVKIENGGECSHLCLNTFARKHCLPSICNQMKFLFAHQLKGENNVLKKIFTCALFFFCRPSWTLCTSTSRDSILWGPVISSSFPIRPSGPTCSRRQPSSGSQLTRTRKSLRWRLTTTHLPKDSETQELESHRKSKSSH